MNKIGGLIFSLLLLLVGCGAEEITGSFKLQAAAGYVTPQHNRGYPHTFIIDTSKQEVYIDEYGDEGAAGEELLAAMEEMTDEEFSEFINSQPIYEEPLYDIKLLEATKDEIVLEYEDERVVFTALSDSYFENEDGIQYVIEYDSTISEYQNSLRSE